MFRPHLADNVRWAGHFGVWRFYLLAMASRPMSATLCISDVASRWHHFREGPCADSCTATRKFHSVHVTIAESAMSAKVQRRGVVVGTNRYV